MTERESLCESLREYADRQTGYIYADEVATLRAAAYQIEWLTNHAKNLQALLREWFDLGDLPSGGYGGTLRYRTEAELGRLAVDE